MAYFVIVYDRTQGRIVLPVQRFPEVDRESALSRRFELEREMRSHPEYEVVVLGAETEEAIRYTHGRYFKTVDELLAGMK